MAKGRSRGLLLAGLAAGAYAYFKKPENREKATVAFNNAKAKVNSYMESQNLENNNTSAKESTEKQKDSSVQYYNEDEQNEEKTKLSPNDTSEEKSEDTANASPETRISTENL